MSGRGLSILWVKTDNYLWIKTKPDIMFSCVRHGICSISHFGYHLRNFELNFSIVSPLSWVLKSFSMLFGTYLVDRLFCYCNKYCQVGIIISIM